MTDDDPSVTPGNHAARDLLSNEEASAPVRIEYEVPVFPGDIKCGFTDGATRIVHKNVEPSVGLFSRSDHTLDALQVADIGLCSACGIVPRYNAHPEGQGNRDGSRSDHGCGAELSGVVR